MPSACRRHCCSTARSVSPIRDASLIITVECAEAPWVLRESVQVASGEDCGEKLSGCEVWASFKTTNPRRGVPQRMLPSQQHSNMSASFVEHDSEEVILSYNGIAHIDQQLRPASSSALQNLAELFVRHDVHNHFGVSLLHRHRALARNSIMVHTRPDPDTDICTMEELGRQDIRPCAFLSQTPDNFLPFEYALSLTQAEAEHLPGKHFLTELGNFLWDKHLQNVFGLCRASPAGDPWIERLLSEDGDTIATRVSRSISSRDGTITQWGFLREIEGGVRIRALKACQESESGGHVRTPDP